MFRIFSKQKQELTSDIDTWIVEWTTYKSGCSLNFPNVKVCYQAFTIEAEAVDFKNIINEAIKMIGITSLPKANLYKQERNGLC